MTAMKLPFYRQSLEARLNVTVSESDFSASERYQEMVERNPSAGAIVQFIGRVRDFYQPTEELDTAKSANKNLNPVEVSQLVLTHYSGMTEKVIEDICQEAHDRWDLLDLDVYHRVGALNAGEQIVLVSVASEHRADAFSGCEFLMDALKTRAPFWKKEVRVVAGDTSSNSDSTIDNSTEEVWLEMKAKDQARADRWQQK